MAVRLSDIPNTSVNTSVRLSDVSVGTRLSDIPETSGEQQILSEEQFDFSVEPPETVADPADVNPQGITEPQTQVEDFREASQAAEKPGLIGRTIKGFLNKFAANPIRTILTEGGFGETSTLINAMDISKQRLKDGDPDAVEVERLRKIIKTNLEKRKGETEIEKEVRLEILSKARKDISDPLRRSVNKTILLARGETVEAVEKAIPTFDVPEAENVAEKAVEIATGVGAFVGRLVVTRKLLGVPRGNLAGSIVAWETENIATGGTPGTGAAMRLALGGIESIPVATLVGKTAKLGAESSLFAGIAAAAGGDFEDVATAALIPLGFKAFNAASRGVAKGRAKRAVKNLRGFTQERGINVENVPDQAFDAIIKAGQNASFWNKQRVKGKITEQVYEQRLSEIRNGITPIFDAIAKQQPAKPTKLPVSEVAKPPVRPAQPAKAKIGTKVPPKAVKPVTEGKIVSSHPLGKGLTHQQMADMNAREFSDNIFFPVRNRLEDVKTRIKELRDKDAIGTEEFKQLKEEENQLVRITGVGNRGGITGIPENAQEFHGRLALARPAEVTEGKQIEVSDTEAAALLGESLEKIKANVELKQRLSKELIITDFQPSDFVPKTKKGPGLTKAEQRIVTPEVQGKLRFAQTQGLPVGFKAGQKESNDIAKRRLDDFRTARKVEKGILQDARKLVTEYAKDPVVAKKLITLLAKVDSPAKMAAFADKIGEFVREAERKQAITSYKTTFNQLKKDNRLGKVAFGKLRPAARERILKFADTIDLQKLSVAKKEELETLMGKVKDLGVDLSEGIAQLDVDTQDALKQLDPHVVALDRLKKTAVSDMGLEEIQIAEDSLRYIIRQNEIQNKEIFGKRVVDAKVREKKAVEEVSVSKKQRRIFKREAKKGVIKPKKRAGVFALLKKGAVGQSRTVPTLVQIATIKDATVTKDVLDTKIWDGIRKTNKVTFESVDFLKKEFTKHSITDKDILSFAKKINVTLAGNNRSVTFGDLGAIEMHLRSLDNIEQLRKTKAMWVQGKRVPGITIQEYVKAAENLTEKQLKFLDIIGNMNRTITAPAVNVSTENLWGYPVARDINYWPLVRKFPVKAEGPVTAFSQAIEHQSPFQPRTGGTQDLVLVPIVEQMWQILQVGARMAGTYEPFHNARTLLNSENWQNKMIESGRQDEMNDIIKIFRRTQGMSSDKNLLEVSFQRILGPVTKSKLSLRVTTPLVQVASFPVAFSEIDGKYARPLKGHKVQLGESQIVRLKKFSPTIRLRFEGGRISPEVGLISAADGFRMLVFGKVSLTSKPLIPLRKMDRVTILGIDIMAQRKIRDTTNLQGDAFWEAVSLETERVTRLTQPMFDHFARSVILTSPNVLLRSGTAFRAPREAMLNVSVRANDLFAKGEKVKAARSWGAVFSSVVMARLIKLGITAGTTALIGFFIRGRVPKREKEFSDFVADVTNDAISIVPFAEIIRPAVNIALGKKGFNEVKLNNLLVDFTVTAGKVAVDGTKAVKFAIDGDTNKAKESLKRAVTGTIQTAAEVKGLPFTGPRDIIKPALKKEKKTETFGRTRKTRTRTTRTRKTRTFGRRRR